ncbi:MAG TPA: folylpolyglutamate synthase/dihydrofolate synthase family protein [Acidimicrobiia bacterium]|nr:folylpolyglutamate synthase/dihydrofolate synthase family protein [Acidimicrobiia bacterium]
MNYEQAVAYVDRHIRLGGEPGLDRIRELLDLMGRPYDGYPLIHIAGTNGKTSTSRLATLILVAHGLTTGTFTSPHLQKVEERLAVNGRFSTPEEFALAISDVAAFADLREDAGGVPNTYFELMTAAALAYFADQAVNAAVLEVGLGGRLDSTNVVDADVCVVTSIGKDHVEFLGDDIAQIAAEKVAIAGPGSILVTGELPEAALEVAMNKARDLGIQHWRFDTDYGIETYERGVGGWLTTIRGAEAVYPNVFLPLHGRYQLDNLAIAIAACEALLGRRLDNDALKDAIAVATAPGRMEPLASSPFLMVDGAHNADGMATLVDSLLEEYPTTRWWVLLGVMGEKNVDLILEHLRPVVAGVVTTAVDSSRAIDADTLAGKVLEAMPGVTVLASENVDYGLDMVRAEAGSEGAVLVTGSLYLVGSVRDRLS